MLKRALFIATFAAALPATATDYTDIWWNPAESGWGVNFAQNGNFIFATFFLYGHDTTPTWYTGQLRQDASGNFTGALYATTGPWFGAVPFDPKQVGVGQVGNATFQPTAADTGTLTYNVAAVQVTKNIQRQTLVPIPVAGSYMGAVTGSLAGCVNSVFNGTSWAPRRSRLPRVRHRLRSRSTRPVSMSARSPDHRHRAGNFSRSLRPTRASTASRGSLRCPSCARRRSAWRDDGARPTQAEDAVKTVSSSECASKAAGP